VVSNPTRGRADDERDEKDNGASRVKGLGNLVAAETQSNQFGGRDVLAGIGMDDDDGRGDHKRMRTDGAAARGAPLSVKAGPGGCTSNESSRDP
jgi:hypothetical protein